MPCWPTRLKPSFQSPQPINGKPCVPLVSPRSSARQQCSYKLADTPARSGSKYASCWPAAKAGAVDERHLLIENGDVTSSRDVLGRDARQPQEIVGKPRSQSIAGIRMPPMQHIAFDKLLAGVAKDLSPCYIRAVVQERGRVLKLIAKTKGAARLIIGRAAPHSATQVLIRQPAIDHKDQFLDRAFQWSRPTASAARIAARRPAPAEFAAASQHVPNSMASEPTPSAGVTPDTAGTNARRGSDRGRRPQHLELEERAGVDAADAP